MVISTLHEIVLDSFIAEISALKPGNVSTYSHGHGMSADDFVLSAELCVPILCDVSLTFGERIHNSVKITMNKVGCNTNLGLLLLFVPVILAAEANVDNDRPHLQMSVASVLQMINASDTAHVFAAIRLANPGGLGKSELHDVSNEPECGLLEAMRTAGVRDRIAMQYCCDFNDIFSTGLESIKHFVNRWNSVEWAVVGCYLDLLSRFPDSHIQRKFDVVTAENIKIKTAVIAQKFRQAENPEQMKSELLDYDRELKQTNINPGTSADLTAASLLVFSLLNKNK